MVEQFVTVDHRGTGEEEAGETWGGAREDSRQTDGQTDRRSAEKKTEYKVVMLC